MKSTKLSKKSYEENLNDDLCNFNSYLSEKSDCKNNSLRGKLGKISRKNSGSKASTKDSHSLNVSSISNLGIQSYPNISNLLELIDSLKDKVSMYETEIGNLLDEKVQMQMMINNLQISSFSRNKKETSKDYNSMQKSSESASELNKFFVQEASGLKKELKIMNDNIEKQKKMLGIDNSILDQTIVENQEKKLENNDFAVLNRQKEMIASEINELKEELKTLIDLQKNISINDEKSILNNTNSLVMNDTIQHKKNISEENNETTEPNITTIPNIEQFFVLNGKISLVDSDKNMWHLNKCRKFQNFVKQNSKLDKEELLYQFLEFYQNSKKQTPSFQADSHNNYNNLTTQHSNKITEEVVEESERSKENNESLIFSDSN